MRHGHDEQEWHPGEQAMHRLLHVPPTGNPTIRGLPRAYALWMSQSPLLALGTMDDQRRIWTTVLGGSAGVTTPIAEGILGVSSPAHLSPRSGDPSAGWTGFDPVLEALFSRDAEDVSEGGADGGRLVAGLAIDLEERTRVKLAGRLLKGIVLGAEADARETTDARARVDVQMALAIDETLGNCPKYLNRKAIRPHEASPRLISDSLPLIPEAVGLIARADIFFLSSRHGDESMDTNNRGGAPGFVRVLSNSEEEGVTLVYPEYSGNRLLQTLGNLTSDPAVGITFPDFETGDVLYLTGRAEVLIGADAAAVMPHTGVAVRITVEAARLVQDGLSFRGRLLDPSPYNPPVRKLARERDDAEWEAIDADGRPVGIARATLIRRTSITPTLTRYAFRLGPDAASPRSAEAFAALEPWRAGQHVTLDFSGDLDQGWSHMRDHDPASLNDDFIRSFTISSEPPSSRVFSGDAEFEITVRENGPVTRHLARWRPGDDPLSAAVIGFGGESAILQRPDGVSPEVDDVVVVVAGGVGITPLLAQAPSALRAGRRPTVLWSVRADDLPLAIEILRQSDGLASWTTVFVTGVVGAAHEGEVHELERLGVRVHLRRMRSTDVLRHGTPGRRRFEVSAGHGLRASVMGWLADEPARFNSFDF